MQDQIPPLQATQAANYAVLSTLKKDGDRQAAALQELHRDVDLLMNSFLKEESKEEVSNDLFRASYAEVHPSNLRDLPKLFLIDFFFFCYACCFHKSADFPQHQQLQTSTGTPQRGRPETALSKPKLHAPVQCTKFVIPAFTYLIDSCGVPNQRSPTMPPIFKCIRKTMPNHLIIPYNPEQGDLTTSY